MTENTTLNQTQADLAHSINPAPVVRLPNLTAGLALLVSLSALGLLGWHYLASKQAEQKAEQNLTAAFSTVNGKQDELRQALLQAQNRQQTTATALGVLQTQLAQQQAQQAAIQQLYQQVTQNSSQSALAEIEQSINIAAQQLQLAGNVRAALTALQSANMRLQALNRAELIPLQRAIELDISNLRAAPYVDTVAISLRLETAITALDKLPLLTEYQPLAEEKKPAPVGNSLSARAKNDVNFLLSKFMRVRKIQNPEALLLTQPQSVALRENLKLRLLSAKIALLQRDEQIYQQEIQSVLPAVRHYFDLSASATQAQLQTLEALKANAISVNVPDIQATLAAVQNAKLTLTQRGVQP